MGNIFSIGIFVILYSIKKRRLENEKENVFKPYIFS